LSGAVFDWKVEEEKYEEEKYTGRRQVLQEGAKTSCCFRVGIPKQTPSPTSFKQPTGRSGKIVKNLGTLPFYPGISIRT